MAETSLTAIRMFAGVLTSNEGRDASEDSARLTSSMSSFPYVQPRVLQEDPNLTLVGMVRDTGVPHLVVATPAPGVKVWLYCPDPPVAQNSEIVDTLSRHDWNQVPSLPGLWLALVWNQNAKSFRIITDRLGGMWVYLARTHTGFAFSCDFAALALFVGAGLRVDVDTALLELVLGYTPGESTIFREIFLPPPGAVTELRGRELRVISRSGFSFGDRYAESSRQEKFEALDAIFDRITRDTLTHDDQVLSFSAGFDSRYALGLTTTRSGFSPRLATFGDPKSQEVEGARSVAALIGQETDLFTFEDADWASWTRCIRTLGNSGLVQWAGWAEQWLSFLRARANRAIIGYLGDALSGKHLHPSGTFPSWRTDWIRWSEGPWATSALISESARERVREVALGRFAQLARGSQYALPHQEALHFDLHGRQRRWVASQPNLMSRYLAPVTFFCDDELYDFWTNVPLEDLLNQKLYLDYAHSRFPLLFPRASKSRFSKERIRNKAAHLVGRVLGRRQRVQPPVVDRSRITDSNKERILALIDKGAGPLAEVVDIGSFRMAVEALDEEKPMDAQFSLMVIRMTNLLLLSTPGVHV